MKLILPIHLFFMFSMFLRISVECLGIGMLTEHFGKEILAETFSQGYGFGILAVVVYHFSGSFWSTLTRFILVHLLLAAVALFIFFLPLEGQAKNILLVQLIFENIVFLSNWELASKLISSSQTRFYFPKFMISSQWGWFIGAGYALAYTYKPIRATYIPMWFIFELILLVIGIYILLRSKKLQSSQEEAKDDKHSFPDFKSFNQGKNFFLLASVFLMLGLVCQSSSVLFYKEFTKSTYSLTAICGLLSLFVSGIAATTISRVYLSMQKKFGLTMIVPICFVFIFVMLLSYFSFKGFYLAAFSFVLIKLLAGCFMITALTTKLNAYHSKLRDHIRFLILVVIIPLGRTGVYFMTNNPEIVYKSLLFLIIMLCFFMSLKFRKVFHADMKKFMKSEDEEEKATGIIYAEPYSRRGIIDQDFKNLLSIDQDPVIISLAMTNLMQNKPIASLGLILNLLAETKHKAIILRSLQHLSQLPYKKLDPFRKGQILSCLQKLGFHGESASVRSLALKIYTKIDPTYNSSQFLLASLQDKNPRVVANTIEVLTSMDYPSSAEVIAPFLESKVPRQRANAIIAILSSKARKNYHYHALRTLKSMLEDKDKKIIVSGIYAVGEVEAKIFKPDVDQIIEKNESKELKRVAVITQFKLGDFSNLDWLIQQILSPDKEHAINITYLIMKIKREVINTIIIPKILEKGKKAQALARRRFASSGEDCYEQIMLLEEKTSMGGSFYEDLAA